MSDLISALQEEQKEEFYMAAIRKDGLLIRYIKKHTARLCLEALKQNKLAIQYFDTDMIDLIEYTNDNRDEITSAFVEDETNHVKVFQQEATQQNFYKLDDKVRRFAFW